MSTQNRLSISDSLGIKFTIWIIDDDPDLEETELQQLFGVTIKIIRSKTAFEASLTDFDPFRLFVLDLKFDNNPDENISEGLDIYELLEKVALPTGPPLIHSGHAARFAALYKKRHPAKLASNPDLLREDRIIPRDSDSWGYVKEKLNEDMNKLINYYCLSTLTITGCYVGDTSYNILDSKRVSDIFAAMTIKEQHLFIDSLLRHHPNGTDVWPIGKYAWSFQVSNESEQPIDSSLSLQRYFPVSSELVDKPSISSLDQLPNIYELGPFTTSELQQFILGSEYHIKRNVVALNYLEKVIDYYLVHIIIHKLFSEEDSLPKEWIPGLISKLATKNFLERYFAILLWERSLIGNRLKFVDLQDYFYQHHAFPKVHTGFYAIINNVEAEWVEAEVKVFGNEIQIKNRRFETARLRNQGIPAQIGIAFKVLNIWQLTAEEIFYFELMLPADYDRL